MARRKAKRRIKYHRIIICIIILLLIIWGITKLVQKLTSSKEVATKPTNDVVQNIANENTVANEETTDASTKPTSESKAIPLTNGQKSSNSVAVLMYHYFYDASKGETGADANWMEISKFEDQLKYLQEHDYYYPTWQELADFVDGKIDLPKNSIVITMDDGHKSVYNLVVPLLDKYKIPATAFIITSRFNTDYVEKYKNSYINFESHTENMHRGGGNVGHGGIFTALSTEDSVADLKESIEKIGGNSGALAYPFGDCTEKTKQGAKQAGFKTAFTTEYGKVKPGMDKYALPRIRIYKDITLSGFASCI